MQKIGRAMSAAMAITLSFALSLTGNLISGHFSAVGFLVCFLISTAVSLLIGMLVPMKPLTDRLCGSLPQDSMKRRCIETLIADLLYTPVITLLMIALSCFNARRHGGSLPFLPAFLRALLISFVIGYVLIFVLTPLFLRLILKKYGVQQGPPRRPEQ